MKDKFDYHDIFSIVIPGLFALLLYFAFTCESEEVFFKRFSSLSLGSSAFLCVAGYILGELIQVLGKLVEGLFWRIFGGKPTYWISEEAVGGFVSWMRGENFISSASVGYIKQGLGISASLTKAHITTNFSKMRVAVEQEKSSEAKLLLYLSKANMYRAFIVICLFALVYNIFFGQNIAISNILLSLIFFASTWRFYYFSTMYSRHLLERYAAIIQAQERPEAPKRALGVE